jgi:hypothetical protein
LANGITTKQLSPATTFASFSNFFKVGDSSDPAAFGSEISRTRNLSLIFSINWAFSIVCEKILENSSTFSAGKPNVSIRAFRKNAVSGKFSPR